MLKHSIAAGLLLISSVAVAQDKPAAIKARTGAPYKHGHSGLSFPAALIDLPRTGGSEFVKPQLDLMFTYQAPDQSEEVSIYLYRVKSGSASLWFDVARHTVEQRRAYGRKTPFGTPTAFTPPGQSNPSAMRIGWTLSEGPFRSTTLTMIPMGEWLVKIRHTATQIEVVSLLRRTEAVVAALGWPGKVEAAPDAAAVADCTDRLALDGDSKPAKVESAGAGALLDAIMAQMAGGAAKKDKKADAEQGPPVIWCADRAANSPTPLYRPNGARDSYLMAASDAGLAIWVRPSASGMLLDQNGPKNWAISVVRAGDTINYPPRDRLPPPTQIRAILDGGSASRVSTWGKSTITIDPAAMK
ncbi:MAG: hypothetical protein ACK4GG_06705 [Sphingomonas sp.]